MLIESRIQREEIDAELAGVLPEREALMMWITVSPVITVEPVVVVGNAIAVQAGTLGGTVAATVIQSLHLP